MSDLGLVAADLSNPVEFHVVTQTMSSIDGGEGVDVLDFGRFAATFLSLWSHFIEPQGPAGLTNSPIRRPTRRGRSPSRTSKGSSARRTPITSSPTPRSPPF